MPELRSENLELVTRYSDLEMALLEVDTILSTDAKLIDSELQELSEPKNDVESFLRGVVDKHFMNTPESDILLLRYPWIVINADNDYPKGLLFSPFFDARDAAIRMYVVQEDNVYLVTPPRLHKAPSRIKKYEKAQSTLVFLENVMAIFQAKRQFTGIGDFKLIDEETGEIIRNPLFDITYLGKLAGNMDRIVADLNRLQFRKKRIIKAPKPPQTR